MVSAIAPGVLGTTGIETVEILKGIVENIKPKLLIVIDALASRSIEELAVQYNYQIQELYQVQEWETHEVK